jgi:hypothetical protein
MPGVGLAAPIAEQPCALAEDAGQRELELAGQPGQRGLAEETEGTGVHAGQAAGDGVDLPERLVAPALAPQTEHGGEQLGELAHESA